MHDVHLPILLVDERGCEAIAVFFLRLLGKLIILFYSQHFETVDDGCVIHSGSSRIAEFLPEISL